MSVAVDRGIRVLPFWWPGVPRPRRNGIGPRRPPRRTRASRAPGWPPTVTPETPWSLSPAHLRAAPFTARLVLPSPNGAAIAAAVPPGVRVVAACLRNVTAVGTWLTSHGYGIPDHPVVVIAAGESWPDGSLRPALEDLLGAGALISDLCSQGAGPLSPEAAAAKASYEGTADLARTVATSASGRELATMGFVEDVAIATEEDASALVPVRDGDGSFVSG